MNDLKTTDSRLFRTLFRATLCNCSGEGEQKREFAVSFADLRRVRFVLVSEEVDFEQSGLLQMGKQIKNDKYSEIQKVFSTQFPHAGRKSHSKSKAFVVDIY